MKVQFLGSAERRQMTPEEVDDDEEEEEEEEEEESSSSSADSLGESIAVIKKDERKPDDRNKTMSYSFDLLEHGGAESGDEDGFVHVAPRLRRGSFRGSHHGRRG